MFLISYRKGVAPKQVSQFLVNTPRMKNFIETIWNIQILPFEKKKKEKKQTCILMDQTGVRNELLIKVFLLTAVTAIKKI